MTDTRSDGTPASFALHLRPSLAKKARLRFDAHSGSALLLYPERALSLGGSSMEILVRCTGWHTVESLIEDLARAHGCDPGDIAADVLDVLTELSARGLLAWTS